MNAKALPARGIESGAGDGGGTVLVLTMLWLLAPTLVYHAPVLP
ncbi:hypothetical protein [Caballeronia sp. BR00000012568055]|nr:hypothetical protein [Caballeronia sp. BR00000012568055]